MTDGDSDVPAEPEPKPGPDEEDERPHDEPDSETVAASQPTEPAETTDQHWAVEQFPLVTDAATVAEVQALDADRYPDLLDGARYALDAHDRAGWLAALEDAPGGAELDRLAELREAEDEENEALTVTLDTILARYERPYPSLVTARIDVPEEFEFVAGQYVTVRYEETPRPYSIASSPTDDTLDICVRRVPDGRLSEDLCERLSTGDEVGIRGPEGEFVLEEPSARDVVFAATGTGVAPLRSMLRYTYDTGRNVHEDSERDVWLFLGAGWADDLPFREEFEALSEEREGFHFVETCSREPELGQWDGETAYVQDCVVKYLEEDARPEGAAVGEHAVDTDARIDPDACEVYGCGVTAMVDALRATLTEAGVPDDKIETEGFG